MAKSHIGEDVKPFGLRRLFAATLIVCTAFIPDASALRVIFAGKSNVARVLQPRNRFQDRSDVAVKKVPLDVLTLLAADEVNSGNTFLSRKRFDVNEKEGTFFLDASPAPRRAVLSETDPYAVVLESLIRVESLKRDFQKAVPNDRFWVKPVDSIKELVKQCIGKIDSSNKDADSMKAQGDCSNNIEEQFQDLSMSVQTYAGKHGLVPARGLEERDPAVGYRVQVKIDPPRARVKIMTALEYKKCLSLKAPLDSLWNDLLDGDNDMIGRYHYLAEWPAELNGTEEGNFEIRKPTTLTFRPKQK